jgi:hypothetical protein
LLIQFNSTIHLFITNIFEVYWSPSTENLGFVHRTDWNTWKNKQRGKQSLVCLIEDQTTNTQVNEKWEPPNPKFRFFGIKTFSLCLEFQSILVFISLLQPNEPNNKADGCICISQEEIYCLILEKNKYEASPTWC